MMILADFNVSKLLNNDEKKVSKKIGGTIFFNAPEMASDNIKDPYPLDIWALGVTLYCLTYLKLPFNSHEDNVFELLEEILDAKINFLDEEREISSELKTLMSSMMEKDPTKRITAKNLKEDKWLNKERPILVNQL